jgi:hypothetical protein
MIEMRQGSHVNVYLSQRYFPVFPRGVLLGTINFKKSTSGTALTVTFLNKHAHVNENREQFQVRHSGFCSGHGSEAIAEPNGQDGNKAATLAGWQSVPVGEARQTASSGRRILK